MKKEQNNLNNIDSNSTSSIQIKEIPLKIKKTAKIPKESKINKKDQSSNNLDLPILKEERTFIQIISTLKLVSCFILLTVSIALIINIANEVNSEENTTSTLISTPESRKTKSTIIGTWITENNSLFCFYDDGTFYWYDDYQEKDNNYYAGTYTYKNGSEALTEMGYSEDEVNQIFGENINSTDIYSLSLNPTYVYKGGQDLTTKELNENEEWWFLLVKTSSNEALGYNKTLDIRYTLKNE